MRVEKIADAIQAYWLTGSQSEELNEWWASGDAASCALEMAEAIDEALTTS